MRRTDGRMDGRTEGRTDGHGDSSIPPTNFVAGGIIITLPLLNMHLIASAGYVIGKHILTYLIHSGIASSGHIIPKIETDCSRNSNVWSTSTHLSSKLISPRFNYWYIIQATP